MTVQKGAASVNKKAVQKKRRKEKNGGIVCTLQVPRGTARRKFISSSTSISFSLLPSV